LSDIIKSESSCSYLYTPVYDSIKETKTKDKNKFHLVQTPQISKFNDLKISLKKCIDEKIDCPDESFAIEYSNLRTSKIRGRRSNIKITEPSDIEFLNKFLTRSGIGFDLHKYEDGSGLILGGYKIDCDYKIVAHSDGDVLLHSIADSILGASGLGDIGNFFSDQDDKNKDLDSSLIVKFCLEKLNDLNLEIYNIDATIICEQPKINPYRDSILKSLSDILQIPTNKIGLKATTSEKIGIIGKNQAIAVQSLVNLRDK
jgi:2-C-methyl-D-erythritol 4-phosphate cytidylyltransferase/2-C-methyl-D-erythritol 2,4-cyclodiphosphate synthase